MYLARGNGAAVPDTERFNFPGTGQCDLAADHHNARIPIMCVVGVHHPRLQPTIEDLITLASQIGFEFCLVHEEPSREQVRTKRPDRPAASWNGHRGWQGVLRPGASEWRQSAESGHSGSPEPAGCQQGSIEAAATSRPHPIRLAASSSILSAILDHLL